MNTENAILWCIAVVIWFAMVCWILWGFQVFRAVCLWIGRTVADAWFGSGGRPR